jgi:hypothetical protein
MIPGLTSHLDSISQELNALLVRLHRYCVYKQSMPQSQPKQRSVLDIVVLAS